jgi:hypothetical protein
MIRRVICHPVVPLLVVITAILGNSHPSAHAQAQSSVGQTPYLIFSTYLGGSKSCDDCGGSTHTFAQNAASDREGNTYVTGGTKVSDLPVLHAWQDKPAPHSKMSAFVSKYDAAGKPLWCTYLGGNSDSMGVGAAAMPDGGVAIIGMTKSEGTEPFPTLNGFQDEYHGDSDYFVTVFDANGKLRYSTYLGGCRVEGDDNYTDDNSNGNNIAVDAQGLIYVTGTTDSADCSDTTKFLMTKNALQPDLKGPSGSTDAFLAIIDPNKSGLESLVYSSFLGGTGNEKGHGITVNADGSLVTVVGYTDSLDFPTTPNGYRSEPSSYHFTSNGFVAQIQSSKPGSKSSQYAMRYSTYLGGTSKDTRDDTYAVALDPQGLIAVTGRTLSADFPMNPCGHSIYSSAPYLKPGSSNDQPYLVKIDPSLTGGASLVYSTYLGGGGFCTGVAIDSRGRAWVAGETDAEGIEYVPLNHPVESPKEFPYTEDALIPSFQGGGLDAILMGTNANGSQLSYSTYLGGNGNDRAYGLAVDPSGNVVVTGPTSSLDFPLKNPAQTWPGGQQNAFITKFAPSFPRPIPAMNSWGELLFFLILAGASVWKIRRRRQGA